LLSISSFSGDASSLYFISINRVTNAITAPIVTVKVLAGDNVMKIKYINNNTTGHFKIFIERLDYTPTCNALLLTTDLSQKLSMTRADESEVAKATYAIMS